MAHKLRGLWIPIKIIQNQNLSKSEMFLLSDIAYFERYYKHRKDIATLLNVNETSVATLLSSLQKKGLIEQIGQVFNKRIYAVTEDVRKIYRDENPYFDQEREPETEELEQEVLDNTDMLMDEVNKMLGGTHALKHTRDRKNKMKARLKSFSRDEILKAAYNLSQSPFHMGDNDQHTKYASLDFLIRKDEQIEKWLYSEQLDRKKQDIINRII